MKSATLEELPLDELLGTVRACYPNKRSRVGKSVHEMARRLRKLDKYLDKALSQHGIWVSIPTVRRILNGEE